MSEVPSTWSWMVLLSRLSRRAFMRRINYRTEALTSIVPLDMMRMWPRLAVLRMWPRLAVLQQRVVRARTPGLSCPQTPAGGLSTTGDAQAMRPGTRRMLVL